MNRYQWARPGDINAFFGLMIDNVAVLVILFTTITSTVPAEQQSPGRFAFTQEFVLTRMIPGTALGVLLGDLVYTWLAFRLAKRLGRSDVTAMPLGLDTPSTFGVAFFILLPALQEARGTGLSHDEAMLFAWRVAVVVLVGLGIFKVALAPVGNAVRRWVPRAGLIGSLAAIALALIAFLPLVLDGVSAVPPVGMVGLVLILVTLVAQRALPGRLPGAFAAVLVGVLLYQAGSLLGEAVGAPLVPPLEKVGGVWRPPSFFGALLATDVPWHDVLSAALVKLPSALPFALATIVGGIDCTESAATAGDEYDTRSILLTEGIASVFAGVLGGVIQTTPYIGQPAYKAMGGRAAYTLATALFIGAAGCFGWFTTLFGWLPRAALFPILVYVGLEIASQSFRVVAARHYPALALSVLPALAALTVVCINAVNGPRPAVDRNGEVVLLTLRCLQNGFIITSLLWAAALAVLLDGLLLRSAAYLLVAAACALFGVIHSPLPEAPIALPTTVYREMASNERFQDEGRPDPRILCQSPFHWSAAYLLCAGLLAGLAARRSADASVETPFQFAPQSVGILQQRTKIQTRPLPPPGHLTLGLAITPRLHDAFS
jgi:AGZA family xanthine/uracil permease-like MFS transporter